MQAEKDHVLQGFFALFNGGPDSGGGILKCQVPVMQHQDFSGLK